MKRLILLSFVVILTTISAFAEGLYRVECNTFVNVREYRSSSSQVLGTIQNNEQIVVYGVQDGWAQIKYNNQDAYISADYIIPIKEEKQNVEEKFNPKEYIPSFSISETGDTTWTLWIILPLVLLLYFIRNKIDRDIHQYNIWRNMHWMSIVGIAISAFEIIYTRGTQDFTWFCVSPRWWWIVINFIVFAFCTYQQVMAYITYTGYVSKGNIKIGLYSWPVCVVLGIILHFTDLSEGLAIGILAIAQFIQAGIIFKETLKNSNIFHAIFFTLTFLIFTLSTAILLKQFISILIIVMIGLLLLSFFASSGSKHSSSSSPSSPSSDDTSNDNPNPNENHEEQRFETEDGAELYYDGFGDWHDSRGRHYRNTDHWKGSELERTDKD